MELIINLAIRHLARTFILMAILVAVVGMIQTFVLVPIWYKTDIGWKTILSTELVNPEYKSRELPLGMRRPNFFIGWEVLTPDNIRLISQFHAYKHPPIGSTLLECLQKGSYREGFSYKINNWRYGLLNLAGDGKIVVADCACEPKNADEVKTQMMISQMFTTFATYMLIALVLWFLSYRWGTWILYQCIVGYTSKSGFLRKTLNVRA